MDTTPAWIPLATAGAALLGGGIGAALQGTFGVNSWRRQTRFEAYSTFLTAAHQFHDGFLAVLAAHGSEEIEEERNRLGDAHSRLVYAASLVGIAGPLAGAAAANQVVAIATKVHSDLRDPDILLNMTARGAGSLDKWSICAHRFEIVARKVLKTEHIRARSLRRWVRRRRRRPWWTATSPAQRG